MTRPQPGSRPPRQRQLEPGVIAVGRERADRFHLAAYRRRRCSEENASVKTVQGELIKLSLKNGKLVLNGNSRVIVADVKASNGVVHAIDMVLVPPRAS